MKFVSIDCETSGLDPENCQLLSFAAVIEDTLKPEVSVEELPSMHVIIRHKFIHGEPYALNMNKDLIEIIKNDKDKRLINEEFMGVEFRNFLNGNKVGARKVQVAGKNFSGFDKAFISKLLYLPTDGVSFSHRVLDVGSVFVDFKNDDWIPNLDECMKRAGVEGVVTHDALEDARDVIRTLRAKY